ILSLPPWFKRLERERASQVRAKVANHLRRTDFENWPHHSCAGSKHRNSTSKERRMAIRLQELHSAAVHLPIALLPIAVGTDLVGRATGSRQLMETGRLAIGLAAAGA